MMHNQFRLNDVARTLGVPYPWLAYRMSTGKTPVRKKIAYSPRDLNLLREWVKEQVHHQAEKQAATSSDPPACDV